MICLSFTTLMISSVVCAPFCLINDTGIGAGLDETFEIGTNRMPYGKEI